MNIWNALAGVGFGILLQPSVGSACPSQACGADDYCAAPERGTMSSALSHDSVSFFHASNTASEGILRKRHRNAAFSTLCEARLTGEHIVASPTPATLAGGAHVVYVTTDAGNLYRFDADACTASWKPTWSHSFRRLSPSRTPICPSDTLSAKPVVQLSDPSLYSGVAGPAHDLVIVPTHYGCTSTDNRVVGVDAATGAEVWRSNIVTAPADYFTSACTVDYVRSQVYCGAHDSGAALQSTLFAYASASVGTVNPVWSKNPGSLVNSPLLRGQRLIVASEQGTVTAFDLASPPPTQVWQVAFPSTTFRRSPVADAGSKALYLVDSLGRIRLVQEAPNSISAASVGGWVTPPGASAVTDIVLVPAHRKGYVGASDGKIWQFDSSSNALSASSFEASARVSLATGGVTSLVLDLDAAAPVNGIAVASSHGLHRWQIPWVSGCVK